MRAACWGIFRELAHSPGREVDDAEILRAVAARLESLGFSVELLTSEEASRAGTPPPLVLVMCERLPILERMRRWEESGVRIVNSVTAIRNTYRDRMTPLFEKHGVSFPGTSLVTTREPRLESVESGGYWIKRGDVHNTQEGDVVFAPDRAAAASALRLMAARGIERAVVQEHVAGDLIKFYGVRSSEAGAPAKEDPSSEASAKEDWFQWFYHRDQKVAGHSFDPALLSKTARRAAAALGLEIYGGDAIATASGDLVVIDLNAWPSFALYREVASERIARHVAAVAREKAGEVETRP